MVVQDVGAAPSLDILRVTFSKALEKAGIDAVVNGADVDFHEAEDRMPEGQQIGSQDRIHVALGHEYVRADNLRGGSGGELQFILTGDDDPTA